jgi:hypothetical protein
MIERKDWIDPTKLSELNNKVYEHGTIDREDILSFLRLIDTTDSTVIINELKKWMTSIHEDPKYDKIVFPAGDIDAVIGDLDSYGVIQPSTILQFKEDSVRNVL